MNTETNEERAALEFEMQRVVAAARDSLTDEMVGRLAGSAAEAMDLMDKAGRAGLSQAIPPIAQMVQNGDLERLVQLARVYHAAQDALTDEMIGRLAETFGEGMSLLDRVNRSGLWRLVEALERMEASGSLARIAENLPKLLERLDMVAGLLTCLEDASTKAQGERVGGGFGNLWKLLTDEKTVRSLKFMQIAGEQLQENCAKR